MPVIEKNKQTKNEGSINLLDIFFYMLSYWYLFAIAIAVCVAIQAYRYSKAPFVYSSNATIMIKDPANTRASTKLDTYSSLINRTNVSNEILQFKSKRLMTEVVNRLGANISYMRHEGLRDVELYTGSPISIIYSDNLAPRYFAFSATPKSDSSFVFKVGEKKKTVAWGDTLSTGDGWVICSPSQVFSPSSIGTEISVSHIPASDAAKRFLSQMGIRQLSDDASLLSFSLNDNNSTRASDILNTLFTVYNEDAINDKNQVAVNTAQFINERLKIIGEELGSVDEQLQAFKTEHKVMSVNEAASQYMADSRSSNAVIVELETRIRLAQFIREYLTNPTKNKQMIPSDTGIEDLRVEGLITQYNNIKMQRDRLVAESSEESPVIRGIDSQLTSMRKSIISSIDNLLTSLDVKKRDAETQERLAESKFQQMPTTARKMLSIERQQNIKENLYLFLLNKREENALSRSMVDNNARIIDSAESTWTHISPVKSKMLMLGFLIGILIPLALLTLRLMFDTRVRNRKEIEENTKVTFVGEIPRSDSIKSMRKNKDKDKKDKKIL